MLTSAIHKAVEILRGGGLVAFPTETYYGLGAVATDEGALDRLCRLKQRPADTAFPLLIPHFQTLRELVRGDCWQEEVVQRLAEIYWPGPLTLVLPARETVSRHLVGPDGGVAVRISGHPVARGLGCHLDQAITATSANFRGKEPACTAQDIERSGLARYLDLVLDGGSTPGGPPSTLLRIDGKRAEILRPGAVDARGLGEVLASLNVELR